MAAYLRGVHQQEFHSHLWSTASWSLMLVPEHHKRPITGCPPDTYWSCTWESDLQPLLPQSIRVSQAIPTLSPSFIYCK